MYFKLYSNCLPVKGVLRSIIYDIGRSDFSFIPNELYEILVYHHKKSTLEIKKLYKNKYDETIDEYFEFLLEKEFIFYCSKSELDSFPKIDTKFEINSIISNAIIDVDKYSDHNYLEISEQLRILHCKFIQIRFYSLISYNKLRGILDKFTDGIKGIDLLLPFTDDYNKESIEKMILNYPLVKIEFHSIDSKKNISENLSNSEYVIPVLFFKDEIKDDTHCGVVDPMYFQVNKNLFLESKEYNSCLHKKISIDTKGNIKNCPSLPYIYGNLKNTTLLAAIHKKEFKKLWKTNKDKINVCKICEFRYMCVDCRAHTVDKEDQYSKPLKCNYDPFTATWKKESIETDTMEKTDLVTSKI